MTQFRKPRTIDLTHNPKIEYINCELIQNTKTILLPTANKLSYMNIDYGNYFTTSTIIAMIEKVHGAVVTDNRHGGTFTFQRDIENDQAFWNLTTSTRTKTRALRDVSGWNVITKP